MTERRDVEETSNNSGVDDDRLDVVLRDYHQRHRTGGPDSVLNALARDVGAFPMLLLREPDGESDSVVQPGSDDELVTQRRRYQFHGEIGRGGVGVIHKGRDNDLGRDIAIKTLLDRHAKNPDMVQRFVAEAQIGGQLQHPGILPVYEMGLRQDQRPYFTMKLVMGQTLAAQLEERSDVSVDLRRFLSIFEQVCQTVAYAHARAVVHRDLKPGNIMIGSFGEVQVVDWGLAKVLDRSGVADEREAKQTGSSTHVETVRGKGESADSVTGSVMGTPAYMPPEQARGEVENLDRRSDVFSLGAILLEILTGRPPYVGESSQQLVEAAAAADLAAAFVCLDDADVDAELAQVARACLAPDSRSRPKDAGVVAKQIADYLSSVEQRARDADVAAAEARVLATAALRQRKLARGLAVSAAVIAILVIVGAGGWLAITHQRQVEREARLTEFRSVLTEAERLHARAAAIEAPGPEPWERARDAAARAHSLSSEDLPRQVQKRASDLLEIVTQRLDAAQADLRRRAENVELMRAFSHCHYHGPFTNNPELRERVERAFQVLGIDIFGDSYDAMLAAMRNRKIDSQLAVGLDAWAVLYLHSFSFDGGVGTPVLRDRALRLFHIADDLDSDRWRQRVREILIAGEFDELTNLLQEPTLLDQDPATIALIVERSVHGGESMTYSDPDIQRVMREAIGRHPTDYRLSLLMSHLLSHHAKPQRLLESLAYAQIAVATRPDDAAAWFMLGEVRWSLDGDQYGLMPIARAVRLDPRSAPLRVTYADMLRRLGHLEKSREEYLTVVQISEHPAAAFFALKLLDSARGESATDYIAMNRALLESCSDKAMGHFQLAMAYDHTGDSSQAIVQVEKSLAIDSSSYFTHFYHGAYLLDRADYAQALDVFLKARALAPDSPSFISRGIRESTSHLEIAKTLDTAIVEGRFGEGLTDQLDFAVVCTRRGRFRVAARLFAAIDDRDPELIKENRWNAVIASLKVTGEGAPDYRRRARGWLHDLLDDKVRAIPVKGSFVKGSFVSVLALGLIKLQFHPDLGCVREPDALAKLPEAERLEWQAFWRKLHAVLNDLSRR